MHFVIYLIRSSIVLTCSITGVDCHLFDVFIEYTELVAKTIRNKGY